MKRWFLSAAIIAVLAGCATTKSSTGRTQLVGGVSQEQLNQLGVQAFTEAKSKGPLSNDAQQNAYVRCVVNALVRQLPAQNPSVAWETALFADKEPNAFALPGGKVGVNTGIFAVARNQDQLAAVLAHRARFRGRKVGIVLSGGNVDLDALPALFALAPGGTP